MSYVVTAMRLITHALPSAAQLPLVPLRRPPTLPNISLWLLPRDHSPRDIGAPQDAFVTHLHTGNQGQPQQPVEKERFEQTEGAELPSKVRWTEGLRQRRDTGKNHRGLEDMKIEQRGGDGVVRRSKIEVGNVDVWPARAVAG